MFLLDGTLVYSASDLTLAQDCEFALLSRLDEKLGRRPRLEVSDPMRERAARLGDEHEARVLAEYRERFGAGVVEIEVPRRYDEPSLREHADRTLAAISGGADVVFQAGFFDGRFHGRSDFLLREVTPQGQASYAVVDTKLARTVKPAAVLQLASYADQLLSQGVPVSATTRVHLGDGTISEQETGSSIAVYREHRAHVEALLDAHQASDEAVAWGDDRYIACLRCDYCNEAIEAARDVQLVWGMRAPQRTLLRAAGLYTLADLAEAERPVPKVRPALWRKLQAQAQLQLRQEAAEEAGEEPHVFSEVYSHAGLDALPEPDAGDVFFDFEGDPLWVDEDRSTWGLEYLFGLIEGDGNHEYITFWAHDRAQEKQALVDFLAYIRRRRTDHPGMHIYHYAPYETAALRRLAERHGVGAAQVEELIEAGVFVDLYRTVKDSLRISQRSYSIKKLEPLYMGDELRNADGVTSGADSVVAYAQALELRQAGEEEAFRARMAQLAEYNRYDCESTRRLRDWLLQQRSAPRAGDAGDRESHGLPGRPREARAGRSAGHSTGGAAAAEEADPRELLADEVSRRIDGPRGQVLAAALLYHRRENEPFWRDHFDRLRSQVAVGDTKDVLEVFHARRHSVLDAEGRPRTVVDLAGRFGTGSTVEPGSEVFTVYGPPAPAGLDVPEGCDRAAVSARVVMRDVSPTGLDRVRLIEFISRQAREHNPLPVLLTPGAPPPPGSLAGAIELVARAALEPTDQASGQAPAAAALDIATRIPPRLRAQAALPEREGTDADGTIQAVVAALSQMADSYLALQGPPGTGKTYLGVHVIAHLVRELGWRIGVVASSHAVVEHVLQGVIDAGLPPAQVGKRARTVRSADLAAWGVAEPADPPWRALETYGHQHFLTRHRNAGAVVGGTAWDFANRRRFEVGELDLLVVDEAGQFSLANTIAVATAAQRLLLLGDPQQLPQVSQGTHDAAVEDSALGTLTTGHATITPEYGYLLQQSRRLHPQLCRPVSEHFYENRLHSHPLAARRELQGLAPGLHVVTLDHQDRTVDSPEESAEVVAQVQGLLGSSWYDGVASRPLVASDFLVVAAYNAQVQRLRHDFNAAGLSGVRIGTVDKFQGQEAPVALLTLAASSAQATPRGLEFLLSPNRLNVAISRGQWAAIVVRSRALTRVLPEETAGVSELGQFIALCERAQPREVRS